MKTTIKAQLVAVQEELYTNYVFKNLDELESSVFRYITVTRCPNWQVIGTIKIGDVGYLEYEFAEAGQDYYDKSSDSIKQYKYTAFYFMNFIKQKEEINEKEFKF